MVFTRSFWNAAGTRALHTIAQTAIATIGVTAVMQEVNWVALGSATALAGLLSVLKSIVVGTPEAPKEPAL